MHKIKIYNKSLKIFLFGMLVFLSAYVQSQVLPAFLITQTNGKIINTAKLGYTKPVILIYFAPDCDHCTNLLKQVFKQIDQFKRANIMLVSFKPLSEIAAFEKEYNTAKYKTVTVGMEQPVFFLRELYKLESTPFTALFDKNGKLISSYRKETPVNDLLIQLKKIK